jgi:hypothetical protein
LKVDLQDTFKVE